MSAIDERIVRMTFDNQKFIDKAKQTIQVMANLKDSFKLDKVNGAFDNIQKSAQKLNLRPMEENVQTIADKFDVLGLIATGALQKIGHQAAIAGERLVSSFTIDPIKMGFEEYETQINAVQTILANTESKGSTLKDVNAALNELNHYADLTIYNFTEMTRNIGTFTAAGVDLKTSTAAIKGIANLAAVSGSTSQQASTAMYQLSQALAAGTVKLQDWNSVVNAGMGGQVFQDALKETARAHKINIDQMIKDEGSFRETLQKGWLTSEVLTETLSKFTGDLSKKQLKSMGYTDKQIKGILKMGKTANDAATKVKTFSQLTDTLMEAAQSGWTQSWQILIGDFEEAKETLTEVSDTFGDIINTTSEARNEVLSSGLSTGWTQLMNQGINDATLFQRILKNTAKSHGIDVKKMIKDNGSFEKSLREGWVSGDLLAESISKMTKKVSKMSGKQLEAKGYTKDQVKALKELNKSVKEGAIDLNDYAQKMSIMSGRENIIEGLRNIFAALLELMKPIQQAFAEVFPPVTGKNVYDLTQRFKEFTETLKISGETAENIKNVFKAVFSVFRVAGTVAITIAGAFAKLLGVAASVVEVLLYPIGDIASIFAALVDHVFKFVDGAKNLVSSFAQLDSVKLLFQTLAQVFDTLRNAVGFVYGGIRNVIRALTDSTFGVSALIFSKIAEAVNFLAGKLNDGILKVIEFANAFKELPIVQETISKIANVFDTLRTNTSAVVSSVGSKLITGFKTAGTVISNFAAKVRDFAAQYVHIPTISEAVAGAQEFLNKTFETGSSLFENIVKFFTEFVSRAKEVGSVKFDEVGRNLSNLKDKIVEVIDVSGRFDQLKGFLSGLDEGFQSFLGSTSNIVEVIKTNLLQFFNWIKDKIANVSLGDVIAAGAGGSLIAFAISLTKFTNTAEKAIKPVAGILSGVEGVMKSTKNFIDQMAAVKKAEAQQATLQAIIKILQTVVLLAGALVLLAQQDPEKLKVAGIVLGALAGGIIALTLVAAKLMENSKPGAIEKYAGVMISAGASLLIMTIALKKIADIPTDKIISSLIAMGVMMAEMAAFVIVVSRLAPNIASGSLSMIGMAVALTIMAKAISMIGDIDGAQIIASIAILGFLGILMGVVGKISGKSNPKAALGLVAVAISLMIMVKAIQKLAELDADTAKVGIERLVEMMGAMAILLVASSAAGKHAAKAGVAIIAMSISLHIIVAAIEKMANLDQSMIDRAGEVVKQILFVFAIITASTALSGQNAAKAGIAIGIMSASMLLLVAAIAILAKLDPAGLQRGLDAVTQIMIMFALIVAATSVSKQAEKVMTVIAVSIGVLAAALAVLSLINPQNLIGAATAISMVMGSMALVVASTSLAKKAYGTLLFMLVVVGALSAIMLSMSQMPFDSAIGAGASLSMVLLSMSASLILLQHVNPAAAMKGVAGLAILIAAMGAILAALSGINELAGGGAAEFLQNGIPMLEAIGAGLGGFIGSFAGSLVGSFSGTMLEEFGESLSRFMENIQGFLDGAQKITPESMSGVESLVGVILMLTGAEFLNGISGLGKLLGGDVAGFLSGESALESLGNDLSGFANSMQDFVSASSEIDMTSMTKATMVMRSIFSLMQAVQPEGGLKGLWEGSSSEAIRNLADVLPHLTHAVRRMVELLEEDIFTGSVNYDGIHKFIGPVKEIFTLLDAIKDEGGVVDWWGGNASTAISNLSNVLVPLVTAVKDFSNALTDGTPNYDAIHDSIGPIKELFTLLDAIKDEGGVVDWWGGNASTAMGNLAKSLEAFGKAVVSYSKSITSDAVNWDEISKSIPHVKELFTLLDFIKEEGGVVDWWTGSSSEAMKNLGRSLKNLGFGMKSYSDSLSEVSFDNINNSLPAVQTLAQVMQSLDEESWSSILGSSKSDAFQNFGTVLSKVGEGVKNYSDKLSGYSADDVNSSLSAVQTLSSIMQSLDEESWTNVLGSSKSDAFENFGEKLGGIGSGLKSYSDNISGFSADTVNSSLDAIKTLAEIAELMDAEGSPIKTFFMGDDSTGLKNFGENLPGLGVGLAKFSNALGNYNSETAQSAVQALKDLSSIKVEGTGGLASQINNVLFGGDETSITKFGNNLRGLAEVMNSFGTTLSADQLANLGPAMDTVMKVIDLIKAIPQLNNDVLQNFISSMTSYGAWGIDIFANAVGNVAGPLAENLASLKSTLESNVPSITEQANQLKESLAGLSLDSVGTSTAKEYTDSVNSGLTSGLNTAAMIVSTKFAEMYTTAKAKFGSYSSDFNNIGSGIASALKRGIESVSLYSLGADMMRGLARGIKENAHLAKTAAADASRGALKSASRAVRRKSPSREFIKLGRDNDRGLALGMKRYSGLVKQAGASVSKEALNESNRILSVVGKMTDADLDYQPSIQPVLDTSMVEAGMGKMNSLLQANTDTVRLNADVSAKMSSAASNATLQSDISKQFAIEQNNAKVVSAIEGLDRTLRDYSGPTNIINGVTYDDGTNIGNAVSDLATALLVGNRS